jgi:unsaturated rhamnogalacturonyl hydrolase
MRKNLNLLLIAGLILLLIRGLINTALPAQNTSDAEIIVRRIADRVMQNTKFRLYDEQGDVSYISAKEVDPRVKLIISSPYNDWRYWNGVLNLAMLELGNVTQSQQYSDFAVKNIGFAFDNSEPFERQYNGENKWDYPFGQFFIMNELDDCGAMGASLIEVYKTDPEERYNIYLKKAAEHISLKQNRLEDSTLVRSFPVKWTIWADDLYMSVSFLARYGDLTGDMRYFDDAAKQVINYNRYLFDENIGLMYHNWYSDLQRPGVAFWGRANGWALLAQIDLLERLPENHPQRDTLIMLFQRHILGIARFQDFSGLWHQLIDKNDSFLETSCSAMFTYAIARAVNLGYLENRYAAIARSGWRGITTKILPDGQIEGVCTGTIVYDDLSSYYQRPTPLNDIHGLGVVILAGEEMIRLSGN